MIDEGYIPNTSPKGFTSALFEELKELSKLPLHDAVRRELAENEPLPLFISVLEMLSMLAYFCMAMEDGSARDWNESFVEDVEGLSLVDVVSSMLFAGVLMDCSTKVTGVGIKNFGFAPLAGLVEGTDGDWNKFVGLPPPLLKVSTYLQNAINKSSSMYTLLHQGHAEHIPGSLYFFHLFLFYITL